MVGLESGSGARAAGESLLEPHAANPMPQAMMRPARAGRAPRYALTMPIGRCPRAIGSRTTSVSRVVWHWSCITASENG